MQYLAQVYFNTRTGGAGDQSTDILLDSCTSDVHE